MLISAGGQLVFTLQEESAIIKRLTRAEVKELEEVVKIQEGLPCIAVNGAKLLVDLHCFFFKGTFNIIEWRTGTLFTVSRRGCEMDAKALHIVDDWGARLDIKLKEIDKAMIKEGKSKKEEKKKNKLTKTKKDEDELKKMTVALGVQSEEGWRCLSEEANRSGKWGRFGILSLCPISLNVCCSQGQGQVPKGVGNYTYGGS